MFIKGIGYARISRDEDKENYDSIINQRMILEKYAEKVGIDLVEIIEDDNVSGYTFDRPGFNRLNEYLDDPDINVIVAKDLSRIGRHNALTLLFLEQVKNRGKWVILPEETSGGYDSSRDDDDIIGIKTWYNERYVKDISRKIRSVLKAKQESGELIVKPIFGYSVDRQQNKLVINEETAQIVRDIFDLYKDGNGTKKIAQILNDNAVPTPSMFVKENYEREGKKYHGAVADFWANTYVMRILKDDVYTGCLRQGKTKKPYIKAKAVKVKKEEQLVFENRHEPIISANEYEYIQVLIRERDQSGYKGLGRESTKSMNVFSGLLFCADCGSYMTAHKPASSKAKGYVCGTYHRRGKQYCTRHWIRQDELITYIKNHLSFIRANMSRFINSLNKDIEKLVSKNSKQLDLTVSIRKKIEMIQHEYKELLSQKVKDIIANPEFKETIEKSYKDIGEEKLRRIKSLSKQLENMTAKENSIINFEKRTKDAISIFDDIINSDIPKRAHLELIINRISVFNDNVDIQLREDIDDLCQLQQDMQNALEII